MTLEASSTYDSAQYFDQIWTTVDANSLVHAFVFWWIEENNEFLDLHRDLLLSNLSMTMILGALCSSIDMINL